jgi:hypothetical protein
MHVCIHTGHGAVFNSSEMEHAAQDVQGLCSSPYPGPAPDVYIWVEYVTFSLVDAARSRMLRVTANFQYNATFSAAQRYLAGSNSTNITSLRAEFIKFSFDPETNVTSNVTTWANFDQPGNNSMQAGRALSYQCPGVFNFTANKYSPGATVAPVLSFTNVGVQSFIPLGSKRPSYADPDAVCPHEEPSKRNTVGLIIGGAIAGVSLIAILIFAITCVVAPASVAVLSRVGSIRDVGFLVSRNCNKSRQGYQAIVTP